MFIKILFIVLFFASTFYIGFYCRKKGQTSNDFALGNRNVGPWLSAFAYGTSYFSAVIFIGYAGSFGWLFGVSALWIGFGNAFIGSLLCWKVLGRRTRLMTQKLNSSTMPDFFGKRYNSNALKIVASIIVFVFLIPYTAALYNGLSSLFNICFTDAIPIWVWIIIISVATSVYTIVGGLMSSAINSFLQGIIMLVGVVLVVIATLNVNGGLMESMRMLGTTGFDGTNGGWEYVSIFGPDPVHLLFVVILTSLGCWGLPQMVGKFYSIKNEEQIKKGNIISTIFAIIVAGGCYFLGGFSRIFASVKTGDIISKMVSGLNVVVVAIVIVLVLAASMSTLSGLVLASSSTVTFDLIDNKKDKSDKTKLWSLRLLVLASIVIAALLAIFQVYGPANLTKDIAGLMGISWGAISGAFISPFLYGLYWKKTTKVSVWVSFVVSILLSILGLVLSFTGKSFKVQSNGILWFDFADSIYMGVLTMILSLVLVPVVSLVTKRNSKEIENVEEIFKTYEHKVLVSETSVLVDKEAYKEELQRESFDKE